MAAQPSSHLDSEGLGLGQFRSNGLSMAAERSASCRLEMPVSPVPIRKRLGGSTCPAWCGFLKRYGRLVDGSIDGFCLKVIFLMSREYPILSGARVEFPLHLPPNQPRCIFKHARTWARDRYRAKCNDVLRIA